MKSKLTSSSALAVYLLLNSTSAIKLKQSIAPIWEAQNAAATKVEENKTDHSVVYDPNAKADAELKK